LKWPLENFEAMHSSSISHWICAKTFYCELDKTQGNFIFVNDAKSYPLSCTSIIKKTLLDTYNYQKNLVNINDLIIMSPISPRSSPKVLSIDQVGDFVVWLCSKSKNESKYANETVRLWTTNLFQNDEQIIDWQYAIFLWKKEHLYFDIF